MSLHGVQKAAEADAPSAKDPPPFVHYLKNILAFLSTISVQIQLFAADFIKKEEKVKPISDRWQLPSGR